MTGRVLTREERAEMVPGKTLVTGDTANLLATCDVLERERDEALALKTAAEVTLQESYAKGLRVALKVGRVIEKAGRNLDAFDRDAIGHAVNEAHENIVKTLIEALVAALEWAYPLSTQIEGATLIEDGKGHTMAIMRLRVVLRKALAAAPARWRKEQ